MSIIGEYPFSEMNIPNKTMNYYFCKSKLDKQGTGKNKEGCIILK
jgi:hypothetical protein